MFNFPVDFAPVPYALSFSAGFSDVQVAVAAWLGMAAVAYLVLLAVALRRSDRKQVEITHVATELRDAA